MIILDVPDLYHDAVCWFAKEYLEGHSITIRLEEKDLDVYGYCNHLEEEFLIEINSSLDLKEKLTTLFHELYHVVQHINNLPRDEDECDSLQTVLLDNYLKTH